MSIEEIKEEIRANEGLHNMDVSEEMLHAARMEHILNFQAMTETSNAQVAAKHLEDNQWDVTVILDNLTEQQAAMAYFEQAN